MKMKRILLSILLAFMVIPLMAQDNGTTLKPNYRRIQKEVQKKSGPYFYDSLLVRFERCDTSLTVDHLRCLYYGGKDVSLHASFHRYWHLYERFGNHNGRVNTAWTQYQMLLTAVWSTGDGSRRRPLHVRNVDDADHIIASDGHGNMTREVTKRCRYLLLHYVAHDEGDYDVWFYVRKQ